MAGSREPVPAALAPDGARRGPDSAHVARARDGAFVELAGVASWVADASGRLVEARTWSAFTGQPEDEARASEGTGWLDAVHPDDRDALRRDWRDAVARGVARFERVVRIRCERAADLAGWRHALMRAAPVRAGGGTREWLVVVADLGERESAMARVGASEARFRALAETLPQVVWLATSDGRLDYVNRRFESVTGLAADDIVGEGWLALLHPDDRERSLAAWERAVREGAPWEIEHRVIGADGDYHWLLSLALPLRDPSGRVVQWVGTATDIDERKRVEAERERLLDAELEARLEAERQRAKAERARGAAEVARREAETARRAAEHANAAKGQFLAAMSHELRTPLNAIAGYAQILDMGLAGPITGEQHQALERIARAEQHLLTIINDILQFAKLEAGQTQLELVDLPVGELCEAVEPLVAPEVAARQLDYSCRVERDEGPLLVRGDRSRLLQILLNLVSNAVKYTEPGGRVQIRARGTGDRVLVTVRDTGRGIPADRLEAIFEPFVQVPDQQTGREGVGLGLSLSRDLARRMGGDIAVESEVGRGSTFTLSLPRVSVARDDAA